MVLTSDALQETLLLSRDVVTITRELDLNMVIYVRAYVDSITANIVYFLYSERDLS